MPITLIQTGVIVVTFGALLALGAVQFIKYRTHRARQQKALSDQQSNAALHYRVEKLRVENTLQESLIENRQRDVELELDSRAHSLRISEAVSAVKNGEAIDEVSERFGLSDIEARLIEDVHGPVVRRYTARVAVH